MSTEIPNQPDEEAMDWSPPPWPPAPSERMRQAEAMDWSPPPWAKPLLELVTYEESIIMHRDPFTTELDLEPFRPFAYSHDEAVHFRDQV